MRNIFKKSYLAITLALAGIMTTSTMSTASTKFSEQQPVNQVPGYYHYLVGDFTVTAVYDGYIDLSPSLLKGLDEKNIQALIARMFQIENKEGIQTAINAYLVNTKEGLVLIDTGSSHCFGPTAGNIVNNIHAAGYQPEEVKAILLTHIHPDHACGITSPEGKAIFPNATVYISEEENNFRLNSQLVASTSASEKNQSFTGMIQKAVAPYIAAKAFRTFKSGEEIISGIKAISTFGHTPGHTSYLIHSGKSYMLILGDIVHFYAVQLAHPEVSIEFDIDNNKAIEARKSIFEKASHHQWIIGGAHLPFPGIGHIRKEKQGYNWIPVEYSSVLKITN
ncbi:MBL fold metallo-hydrolase [Xenorhabdus sp. Flor]|uniref:MBL fold metallo-hydrolase n=1 Tax=Xenorhabdus cabanillasii TaxID=351673 RepID=UPI001983BD06|nr:MBL fold metallo-hydrolase [Xenorhabdus sp. Flor]MBD2816579.1 MBL fold metallo-hydrolase [Xenorhabdus sp. Flor]